MLTTFNLSGIASANITSSGTVTADIATNIGTYNPDEHRGVIVYQLPTLPTGETISSVSFSVNSVSNPRGNAAWDVDLVALPIRSSSTITGADFGQSATTIQSSFLDNAVPTNDFSRVSLSGTGSDNLASFLNANYAANSYLVLRMQPDSTAVPTDGQYYNVSLYNHFNSSRWPRMTLTSETSTLSASLDGSGSLVITDVNATGKNNALTVSSNGSGSIVITDANDRFIGTGGISGATLSNGNKTLTVPLTSIPNGSLTINAGKGNDTVTIASLDAAFRGSVTINGDEGTDTVNWNAAAILGSDTATGNVTVVADTITVTNSIAADTGRMISVSLISSGNVTLSGANADVTTGGGTFTIDADSDDNGSGAFATDAGSAIVTSAGAVSITAAHVRLQGSIDAGGSAVSISPSQLGRAIFLGVAAAIPDVLLNAPLGTGEQIGEIFVGSDTGRVVYSVQNSSKQIVAVRSVEIGGGTDTLLNAPLETGEQIGRVLVSPDSARVVYTVVNASYQAVAIRSVPIGGGTDTLLNAPLGTGEQIDQLLVSPVSDRVVYTVVNASYQAVAVRSVPIGGGTDMLLNAAIGTGERINKVLISPDSARVVYTVLNSSHQMLTIRSVPIGGGTDTLLNAPLGIGERINQVLVSPDSARVVYTVYNSVYETIAVRSVPIAGGTDTLLSAPLGTGEQISEIFFSSDSARVVYSVQNSNYEAIAIRSVPIGGGTDTLLTAPLGTGEQISQIFVSSDSAHVVYTVYNADYEIIAVRSVPIGGGTDTLLNAPFGTGEGISQISVSPDSARVVYTVYSDYETIAVHSVPIGGGTGTLLNTPLGTGEQIASFSISPDSTRVVYCVRNLSFRTIAIRSVPIGGGIDVLLNDQLETGQRIDSFLVTPDSARVVYSVRDSSLRTIAIRSVPIGGGTDVLLNEQLETGQQIDSFSVTPDSDRVLYSVRDSSNQIVAVRSALIESSSFFSLADTELDHVTAGTINIGDLNSGAITFSADITRVANTNVNLTAGSNKNINFGVFSLNAGSGNVSLTTSGTGAITTGDGIGTDITGNLSLVSGSTFLVEAQSTSNIKNLSVVGTVSLGNATLNVEALGTPVVNNGDTFLIIDNDGTSDTVVGTFNGLAEGAIVSTNFLGSGKTARISYVGGNGNDVVISIGGADTTAPTASVRSLPLTTTTSTITLTIDVSDPAGAVGEPVSGVASYDVYVAVDSGAWSLFVANVPASQSTVNFTPSSNHRYWFRAVAKDNAGNVEVESSTPPAEASTYVTDFEGPSTAVVSATADASGLFSLNLQGSDVGGSTISRFRVFVKIDDGTAVEITQTNVAAGAPNGSGVQSATTSYQGLRDGVAHSYTFFTRAIDTAGNLEAAPTDGNADIRQIHTFAPPTALAATGIDVQNGQTQRSYIRNVDLLFNDQSGLQSLIDNNRIRVERFDLLNSVPTAGTGTSVSITGATVSGNSIKLDFGADGLGGVGRAGNGFYRILVDTNGDGTFNDSMFEFFRLYGDSNGDGKVTSADGTVTEDLSGDGLVNATDRAIWRRETAFKLHDSLFALLDD